MTQGTVLDRFGLSSGGVTPAGREIRDARLDAGLSVAALAKATGVSASSIKRFEVDPPEDTTAVTQVQKYLRVGPFKGMAKRITRADIYALPDDDLVEVHQVAGAELVRRFTARQSGDGYEGRDASGTRAFDTGEGPTGPDGLVGRGVFVDNSDVHKRLEG